MTALRRLSASIVSAYVAAWIPGVVVWLLGLRGSAVAWVLIGAATLIGAVVGYRGSADLPAYSRREHRDAVIGWSIVLVPIGAMAAFLVPVPWAFAAAAAWVAAVLVVGRALLATAPPDPDGGSARVRPAG